MTDFATYHRRTLWPLHLVCVLVVFAYAVALPAQESLLRDGWQRNGFVDPSFVIQGAAARNNPLRQSLRRAFNGEELFVRFRLRYDGRTVDSPPTGDGEFVVLWLDEVEGGDATTHSGSVPNVGIHVDGEQNRFMVRYSPTSQRFGPKLVGDRDYLVVARLWKSSVGVESPFDRLDFWLDPQADAEFSPVASTKNPKAISTVRWVGFSTGGKTEPDDRITVWDIALAESWSQVLGLPTAMPTVPRPAAPTVQFAEHVFPILKQRCFKCHQGEQPDSDVRLDVWDEVLNHTSPRNAAKSRLFELVSQGAMPPKKEEQLPPEELAVLRAWIDEGLRWDEKLLPTPTPKTSHWSFQPIKQPKPPQVSNASWVRTPIDAFIARRHDQLGIQPSQEADKETLRRRLSLDLTGLPPRPGAATDLDSVLASKEYGERWARHWLDVARWAESNGHQHNRSRAHAWRYRDWVVDAFNSDKPFDAFLREQLAGDELEPYSDANIIATGFLAAARYSGNELDKDIQRNDILVDVANTTAKAFLGLTLECAQCHTHKFDPLSLRDYYSFQSVFAAGQPGNVVLRPSTEKAADVIQERWRLFDTAETRLINIRRRQGQPPVVTRKSVVASMKPKELNRFRELDKQISRLPQTWGYYSSRNAATKSPVAPHDMRFPLPRATGNSPPVETRLLIRGDVKSPGPEVRPAWPRVFGRAPEGLARPRLALADWMCHPTNTLTARVWVNRVWQWHFGRGLVETSGDFGDQGARPTHPELLDYLATELIISGWSTKHIHRLIVDSATYRQSSQFSARNAALDAKNQTLWRWEPRRLEAEAIRDSLLAVSGQLENGRGGPSVAVGSNRRSLYLKHERDRLPEHQLLFDAASGAVSCSRRRVSTTPIQPLWLLNSDFAQRAASKLAQRAESVDQAMLIAFGRSPRLSEKEQLEELAAQHGLVSACLAILNSSEFVYIP